MIDVKLEIFRDSEKTVVSGSRVHFYSGSSEILAKVVLLDREALEKGDSCFCQLRLEEEAAARRGDRFIIRFFSPLITIGGGKILETSPRKHKRFDENTLKDLEIKDSGSVLEVLDLVIREKSRMLPDRMALALKLDLPLEEVDSLTDELISEGRIFRIRKDQFVHLSFIELAERTANEILGEYHRTNKMSVGIPKAEFKSRLNDTLRLEDGRALEDILAVMSGRECIKDTGNIISLFDFKVSESPETAAMRERILKTYREAGYEMPTVEAAVSGEKDKVNAVHIIDALSEEGRLVRLDYQYFIDKDAMDKAMEGLKRHIEENGRITLAEFRDMLGTSRKYAMAILDYTDKNKITEKKEDYRVLYQV
ncbi:MAG: SelB C-terminal domain-containing protein [Firmicutes bacterium]|nr:SelB C-terminal domain-containing protein [Bacillota bacterium]